MMEITGTLPSIIANEYEAKNGNMDNIIVKGNDIDVQFYSKGSITSLVALWLGNGSFEITEIEDDANIFPEYSLGDVISVDAIKKILFQSINSSLIVSYSLKGKVKEGVENFKKNFKKKFNTEVDRKAKNIQDKIDWFSDNLSSDQAQQFIRKQPGFEKAKVGAVELIDTDAGKTYKVLVGNPSDKTYSLWQIRRNGNSLRTVTAELGLEKDSVLTKYYKLKTVDDDEQVDENDDNVIRGKGEIVDEPEETQEPISQPDLRNVNDRYKDDIYVDDYTIVDASLKRKKKKSKYNGCNVTGCEDGNLSAGNGAAPVMCNLIEW